MIRDLNWEDFQRSGANSIACVFLEDAREYGLVQAQDGYALSFSEKPKEKVSGLVNGGWYLLAPRALRAVGQDAFMLERDLFPQLAKERNLKTHLHKGYWIDAGTHERLQRVDRELSIASRPQ